MNEKLILLKLSVIPFAVGLFTAFFLIKQVKDNRLGLDSNSGVQKIHQMPTSRLGGISVMLATISGYLILFFLNSKLSTLFLNLMLCASPVFIAGLLEDLTQRVSPKWRLIGALLSAFLVVFVSNVKVIRTDFFLVDFLLQSKIIVLAVSVIVIAGFTNAINLIDGFHGLALSQVMLIQFFLGLMAWESQQLDICFFCLVVFVSALSLLVLNWPRGKIFLGDGGAYFLGFMTVSLGLIFLNRVPNVSPLCLIVLGAYPLIDATFSMYRRRIIRLRSISSPDHLHMHSLIYRRLIKQKWRELFQKKTTEFDHKNEGSWKNASVGLFLFVFILPVDCLAWYFQSNSVVLSLILVILVTVYIFIFNLFCHFKIRLFQG